MFFHVVTSTTNAAGGEGGKEVNDRQPEAEVLVREPLDNKYKYLVINSWLISRK